MQKIAGSVRKILWFIIIVFFFLTLAKHSYALTLPTPNLPSDWDSNAVCSDSSNTCYNNYIFVQTDDPVNSYPTHLYLARLVCANPYTPLSGGFSSNHADQFSYSGFWNRITLPFTQTDHCHWGATWNYDFTVSGSWSSEGHYASPFTDPSYSLATTIFTNFAFTAGFTHNFGSSYGSLGQVNSGDTLTTISQISKTPLILIPGIMGSKLAVTTPTPTIAPIQKQTFDARTQNCVQGSDQWSYNQGDLVWINEDNSILNLPNIINKYAVRCSNFLDVLQLQSNGQPVYPQVGLNGAITDSPYNNSTIPYLQQQGYTPGVDLFTFPYDWRKDIASSEAQLEATISSVLTQTGASKVDVLAHSMGGLLARDYISDASRAANVDTLVELGTPHAGTPQFLAQLLYPTCPLRDPIVGIVCIINGYEANKLVQHFPGGFELLPSKLYYQLYSYLYPFNETKNFNDTMHLSNGATGALGYDQLNILLSQLGKDKVASDTATLFHNTLDTTYATTSGVKTYLIAGSGIPTMGQLFDYVWSSGSETIKHDALSVDGDGTVATRSATLNQQDITQNNVFFVNEDHESLAASGSALTMAVNLFKGNTDAASVSGVRTTPFAYTGKIISVHSPVELDAYDDQGNHTGSTSAGFAEENIPGSTYDELGDAKFIYLPTGGHYHITTKATAVGSFDLKMKTFTGGTLTKQLLYLNVNQTAQSTGSASLDDTTPTLSLDVNGDGTNVQSVSPTYTLTGNDALDYAPPVTTATFSSAPNTDGTYSDQVTVTLAATASAGFSISHTYYTIDGGSQQTYSSPFTVSSTGSHTIMYWSVDSAGLTEATNTKTFRIIATIALRASSSANNSSGSATLTINKPTGTANGDVIVAHVVIQTAGNSIAAPTGWNIIKRLDTSNNIATATYWKAAGSSEPSSYTWTFGTSGEASGGIASYTGVDTTAPIDASTAQYNNTTANIDNSGITTTSSKDMLVYAVGIVTATSSITVPAGFTEEWKTSSTATTSSELSQELFTSNSATGTLHGTLGSASSNVTHLIALRPAGAVLPTSSSGISFRSSSSGNNGAGGSSLTISTPSNVQSSDVMVAHVVVQTSGNAIAAPSGWTIIKRQDTSTNISTATYFKVASTSEPSNYTWNFGTSGEASGGIGDYSGVNTTTPIDVSSTQYNNGTSNVDNTGVTTTADNDMLVYEVGIILSASVQAPAGFMEGFYSATNSKTTSQMFQEIASSSAATGTIHTTITTGSYSSVTQLIALKPATAPTPTPPSGISLRSSTANTNASGSATLTLNKPTGTANGDVMVAHVVVRTAGNTITAPSGWTQIVRKDTGSALSTVAYWKVAGSSEPASYTWNFGTSGEASGGIGSYIGVNNTTPIDASNGQYNSATNNVDNSGVTTTASTDLLVYAVGIVQATSVNPPSGFTEKWYTASNAQTTSEMSQELDTSTGATGTVHGTENGGGTFSNVTLLIALKAQ